MNEMNLNQADKFLKDHKGEGYSIYIGNPMRRTFIRYDNAYFSLEHQNYILKSNDQVVDLNNMINNKIEVIKVIDSFSEDDIDENNDELFELKENANSIETSSDDVYYDFFDNFDLNPEDFLKNQKDINKVNEAREILNKYFKTIWQVVDEA